MRPLFIGCMVVAGGIAPFNGLWFFHALSELIERFDAEPAAWFVPLVAYILTVAAGVLLFAALGVIALLLSQKLSVQVQRLALIVAFCLYLAIWIRGYVEYVSIANGPSL